MGVPRKVLLQEQGSDEATLYIYDVIDPFWGVSAEALVRELDALEVGNITVRINSPGGDVFDGIAIFNALKRHSARVTARVEGMAASIASVIMLAADEIVMAEGAFVMVHNPWLIAFGDVEELRKSVSLLEKVTTNAADIYARATGADLERVRQWMDAETWFNAEEAVDAGFATSVEGAAEPLQNRAAARFDFARFRNMPERAAALARPAPDAPPSTIREFERFLRDEGNFSHAAAKAIAAGGFKPTPEPRDEDDDALTTRLLAARLGLRGRTLRTAN